MNNNTIIKCPNCGQIYRVYKGDYNKDTLTYHCDNCGKDWQVEFFDHCPTCHVNIGFIDTNSFSGDMKELGLGLVKGLINPLSIVNSFGGFFVDAFSSDVKEANGDGVCPICKKRYIRCPRCNELFVIRRNVTFKEKQECSHCGCQIMPCCSVRKGCGFKHSRDFFK